jgi:hypothetical protein
MQQKRTLSRSIAGLFNKKTSIMNSLNFKKIKKSIFYLSIIFCVTFMFACKKDIDGNEGTPAQDMSGSILDKKDIDTTWTSPDGSMKLAFKFVVSQGPSVGGTKTIYKIDLLTTLVSGKFQPYQLKLKFRHFPQNYTEYDEETKKNIAITEAGHTTYQFKTLNKELNIYKHIPDPGPIDKIEFSKL